MHLRKRTICTFMSAITNMPSGISISKYLIGYSCRAVFETYLISKTASPTKHNKYLPVPTLPLRAKGKVQWRIPREALIDVDRSVTSLQKSHVHVYTVQGQSTTTMARTATRCARKHMHVSVTHPAHDTQGVPSSINRRLRLTTGTGLLSHA